MPAADTYDRNYADSRSKERRSATEQATDTVEQIKARVHLSWVPDKAFHLLFVALVVLTAWYVYDNAHSYFRPQQRSYFPRTPGMSKAEDALYQILDEVKAASEDAFDKAHAEVQAYAKKAKSGSSSGVEESYNAALGAIKSLQNSLSQVENKATTSLQDMLSKAKATIRDKVL